VELIGSKRGGGAAEVLGDEGLFEAEGGDAAGAVCCGIGLLDNAHTAVSTRTFLLVPIYYYLYRVNTRLINDNARRMITASLAESFTWRLPSLARFPRLGAELSSVRRSSPCWFDQQG
jgi:hypothetical protein